MAEEWFDRKSVLRRGVFVACSIVAFWRMKVVLEEEAGDFPETMLMKQGRRQTSDAG